MPKRYARISAVCPIDRPTTGSVRPRNRAMTGLKKAGRNAPRVLSRAPGVRARDQAASQLTMAVPNRIGAWLMASTPPASTRLERPLAIFWAALSMDCSPEAQLRCTVQAGTLSPQPRRRAATRPMLVSSGPGLTQPSMTSSNSVGANGWRASNGRPAATARSAAANRPGLPRALRDGVRLPSTTWTGRPPHPVCSPMTCAPWLDIQGEIHLPV